MTRTLFTDRLKVACSAARKAGEMILSANMTNIAFQAKGKSDVVTHLDTASERLIRDLIHQSFPSDNFLGEEEGLVEYGDGGTWIVDPIDGTNNLVHGIPGYTISIAYEVNAANPVLGVVFSPQTNELFHAAQGSGAFLNGKSIRISSVDSIDDAVSIAPPPLRVPLLIPAHLKIYELLCREGGDIRDFGSAALHLCYVAMGRVEAFAEFRLKYHDYAAGKVLVEEAGGCFSSLHSVDHMPYQDILATNKALFPWYTHSIRTLLGEPACNDDSESSSHSC